MKNAFEHEADLAALREELAKANADKKAYAQNAIDLRTSLDAVNLNLSRVDEALQTRTADLLACGTRRKAAEQRNADAVAKLELCQAVMDKDERGKNIARALQCVIDALNPTESGSAQ